MAIFHDASLTLLSTVTKCLALQRDDNMKHAVAHSYSKKSSKFLCNNLQLIPPLSWIYMPGPHLGGAGHLPPLGDLLPPLADLLPP